MSQDAASQPILLYLGALTSAVEVMRRAFPGCQEIFCDGKSGFEAYLPRAPVDDLVSILIGPRLQGLTVTEVLAALAPIRKSAVILYATDQATDPRLRADERRELPTTFHLPKEANAFEAAAAKAAAELEHRKYSRVRLVDIEAGDVLDFQISVFLPSNNKYLVYSSVGDMIEPARLLRLVQFKQKEIFIPVAQVEKFHVYSARRLIELDPAVENGEKKFKLRKSISQLLHGMIADGYAKQLQGKRTDDHSPKIVFQYMQMFAPAEWCRRVMSEYGASSPNHSHGRNVGTYAALFAIALGIHSIEEAWVAGVLHDIGMEALPEKVREKRPEQMSEEAKVHYLQHPQLTLKVLQTKNYDLPESVLSAISNHQERWNGTGFPHKLSGSELSVTAQLVALADRFDYLTRAINNVSPMSAEQAMKQLELEGIANPDLIRDLRLIFDRETKAVS